MTQVLVIGADSLVGSHFVGATRHDVVAAGRVDPNTVGIRVKRFTPLDATKPEEVRRAVQESSADVVVNFAAATDVDGVERERPAASPEAADGRAFALNVSAPAAIAAAARASGKYLVAISTDFVFDGRDGPYSESAEPSAWSPQLGWYGWTKGEGERRTRAALPTAAVVRISYPYRVGYPRKLDFARNIVTRRKAGTLPPLFTDQILTPTWIPDLSRALDYLVESREAGAFHVASPDATSPWEFATALLHQLEGRSPELPKGSMEEYLRRPGVTPRPRQGGLIAERLPSAGVPLTTWRTGVSEFAKEGGGTG